MIVLAILVHSDSMLFCYFYISQLRREEESSLTHNELLQQLNYFIGTER